MILKTGKCLNEQLAAHSGEAATNFTDQMTPAPYKELFRLRGWKFPNLPADQRKRPILVGRLTNDIVYDRLAPGVREELHRLTPRDDKGRLKHKLFQRLTVEVGSPKLREHLASVVALMKAADKWGQFVTMINRALPRYNDTAFLPFEEE
jgi:hypothetical protein